GYEPALADLQIKADDLKRAGYGAPGSTAGSTNTTRSQYGAIEPPVVFYELTGDAGYLNSAVPGALLAPHSLAISPGADSQGDKLFPNLNFGGMFLDGIRALKRLGGDATAYAIAASTVRDFETVPTSDLDAPDWDCTAPPGRSEREQRSYVAFAMAALQS